MAQFVGVDSAGMRLVGVMGSSLGRGEDEADNGVMTGEDEKRREGEGPVGFMSAGASRPTSLGVVRVWAGTRARRLPIGLLWVVHVDWDVIHPVHHDGLCADSESTQRRCESHVST